MYRSISRQITNAYRKAWYFAHESDLEDPEYPCLKSMVNQYDICDWYYIDKKTGYRK